MEELYDDLTIIDPDLNHFESDVNFETHTITTFSNKQDIDLNALKIIHHNARSLMKTGRIDEYHTFLQTLKTPFDILIFSETWLTSDKIDLCRFDGFQSIHLIRPSDDNLDFKVRGGGISIFIKDNLEFKHRDDLTIILPFMECSFIEIKFNNQNYLIGGIYRIPNTDIDEFIEIFNSIIEPIKSTHKIILLGDYNIDLLKNYSHKNNFEICLQSNYLIPTILSATRVASKMQNDQEIISETLIDNIFINHNMNYQSGIIESSITDHYSIYIIIPEINKPKAESNTVKYRLINNSRLRTFHCYLNHLEIDQVFDNHHAESAYSQFYDIFDYSYNKSFPIKTKTFTNKDSQKPWVNEELINGIKRRDQLNKAANKKRIDRKEYTDYRNALKTKFREAKAKYYKDQFEANAKNILKNVGSNK